MSHIIRLYTFTLLARITTTHGADAKMVWLTRIDYYLSQQLTEKWQITNNSLKSGRKRPEQLCPTVTQLLVACTPRARTMRHRTDWRTQPAGQASSHHSVLRQAFDKHGNVTCSCSKACMTQKASNTHCSADNRWSSTCTRTTTAQMHCNCPLVTISNQC
jgi:hypothetical protein